MDKVYTLLHGRLGNILFETAVGLSYAKRYNKELHLAIKFNDKRTTPVQNYELFSKQFKVDSCVQIGQYTKIVESDYKKIPNFLPKYDGSVILDGYFQSEIYFDIPYVKSVFRIDSEIKKNI